LAAARRSQPFSSARRKKWKPVTAGKIHERNLTANYQHFSQTEVEAKECTRTLNANGVPK
jgi:hypothetical protein